MWCYTVYAYMYMYMYIVYTIGGDIAIVDERLLALQYSILHNLTQEVLQLTGRGGL